MVDDFCLSLSVHFAAFKLGHAGCNMDCCNKCRKWRARRNWQGEKKKLCFCDSNREIRISVIVWRYFPIESKKKVINRSLDNNHSPPAVACRLTKRASNEKISCKPLTHFVAAPIVFQQCSVFVWNTGGGPRRKKKSQGTFGQSKKRKEETRKA